MPPTPEPHDVTEILTSQRITAALTALTDPAHDDHYDPCCLSETEREVIQQALGESPHPLAGFAYHLIDQWDHAEPDDRVAGLLLFKEITTGQKRRQSQEIGRSTPPGLRR